MKSSKREDIEAPIDYVYARVTDFQGFERQALRRAADLQRVRDWAGCRMGRCVQVSWYRPQNVGQDHPL